MRSILYCGLIVLMGVQAKAVTHFTPKADTGVWWQVACNGKEILPYTMDGIRTYIIDSIADNDVITVDYYTDTPCDKCRCRLQFRDDNGKILATVEKDGFGTGAPFKLPGMQFRQLIRDHKLSLFFTENFDGWSEWEFLGMVKTMK